MTFFKSAIIILLNSYCAFLSSQTPYFSREFGAIKSNVSIKILNYHKNFFYVLRYNKSAHDFVLEKHNKPDAQILTITPLKLDSLNASWFDFENLDHSIFCDSAKIYFVFKKVLNNKKTVYIKQIDTLGHAGSFKEIASVETKPGAENTNVDFYITGQNKLLLISAQRFYSGLENKVATLYNAATAQTIWIKKLPPETVNTGYSTAFTCANNNNLYYVLQNNSARGYYKTFVNNLPLSVPLISCDSMWLVNSPANSTNFNKTRLGLQEPLRLNTVTLFAENDGVYSLINGSREIEENKEEMFFLIQKYNSNLSIKLNDVYQPLDSTINKQLNFYDGSDDKSAASKFYASEFSYRSSNFALVAAGRKNGDFSKELLLCRFNPDSLMSAEVKILPRKLFYFKQRSRFHYLDNVAFVFKDGNLFAFLSEHASNAILPAGSFNYHRFTTLKSPVSGMLTCYQLQSNGVLNKKTINNVKGFAFIPLMYQGNQPDFIYYLNSGKKELFAILQLNPF